MSGLLFSFSQAFSRPTLLRSTRLFSVDSQSRLLNLNDLQNVPGSRHSTKRVGRGPGSGLGKLCGFGHQKSRCTPRGFEGGQTPLYRTLPKIGMKNPNHVEYIALDLARVQDYIDMGRLVPKPNTFLTIRDLLESGCISKVNDGVKILAKGGEKLRSAIHLEVSAASKEAIKAVEAKGGTVTAVHLTPLSLRALIKPFKFSLLPLRARPPPRKMPYYLDATKCGYLSPEVQKRNLSLFGALTSEDLYRKEFEQFAEVRKDAVRTLKSQWETQQVQQG